MYIYTRTLDTPLEKKSFKISILTKKIVVQEKVYTFVLLQKKFSRVIFLKISLPPPSKKRRQQRNRVSLFDHELVAFPTVSVVPAVSASKDFVITRPKIVFTFHPVNLATPLEEVIFALAKCDFINLKKYRYES